MATTYLNLTLPTPTVTLGPEWATEIVTAFETIDFHDHTPGFGKLIPIAGLDINDDLNFQFNKIFGLFSTQFVNQTSPLSGAPNAGSVSISGGNLYFTNGGGVPVQITNGGSVITVPATIQTLQTASVNTNLTISPSSTFVYLIVDTTASRTITLPLASAVAGGRLYVIKDANGLSDTNPVTITVQGGDTLDGTSSFSLDSNYGTIWVVGDGASKWFIS